MSHYKYMLVGELASVGLREEVVECGFIHQHLGRNAMCALGAGLNGHVWVDERAHLFNFVEVAVEFDPGNFYGLVPGVEPRGFKVENNHTVKGQGHTVYLITVFKRAMNLTFPAALR